MKKKFSLLLLIAGIFSLLWAGCESSPSRENPPADSEIRSEAILPDESEPAETESDEAQSDEPSTFSVRFIDVGQADSALVECDGHYMLIDGGNKGDSDIIYTVLKNANVSKLDIVVGTHGEEDHIGGLPGAFRYASADLTLCPVTSYDSGAFEDFSRYANEKGGGITVPAVGDSYSLGSAAVTVVGVNGGSEANDTSIVLKIEYGATSFLFTGDAQEEAEQAILRSGADLSATVLKTGHHGSETSTSDAFLREIMPSYAIISVGKNNTYGHPSEAVLNRLQNAGAAIYRTDLQGDIVFTSDGKSVSVTTGKSASEEKIVIPGKSAAADPKPMSKAAQQPILEPESEPVQQPQAKPAEQSLPEAEPASGTICWKSATGDKYHSINNCGRMNPAKAEQITVEQAVSIGLKACSKCW